MSTPDPTSTETDVAALLGPDVVITVCPDGPLLVRGGAALVDGKGADLRGERRTLALCRCGRSGIAPFCDGTHKKRRGRG
ncbi:hypothetical protein GCM10027047_28930 [Rhodococcus aerolatus]